MTSRRSIAFAAALWCGLGCASSVVVPDAQVVCDEQNDADGDGILDADEGQGDTDGDGVPDALDLDSDGDGIPDAIEAGDDDCATPPRDTDGDGTPDFLDEDADGDGIRDLDEGTDDPDADGVPNYLDLDSDGDDVSDAVEAGDDVLETPPAHCDAEFPPPHRGADGLPDFLDPDADDDGLADGEEVSAGTSRCSSDTDGDGDSDLGEVAYARVQCASDPSTCDCALDADCRVPTDHLQVALWPGVRTTREVELEARVGRADVVFLLDTTHSMGPTLTSVQAAVGSSGRLLPRLAALVPDLHLGFGEVGDLPLSSFGGDGDAPLAIALRATPVTSSAAIVSALSRVTLQGGGDPPEAHTEALFQTIRGSGASWTSGGRAYVLRAFADDCLSGWGAACFRDDALPFVVLLTDVCSHQGPPGTDREACGDYDGVAPAPSSWDAMVAALRERHVTFVGGNTNPSWRCVEDEHASGTAPCAFLARTARESGSVDVHGTPLVFDAPSELDGRGLADVLVEALAHAVTSRRRDVDAQLRTDPRSPRSATVFARSVRPSCAAGSTLCWTAPAGVSPDDAVRAYDERSFAAVAPGTRLSFQLELEADPAASSARSQVLSFYVDARGDGVAVLQSRRVFVILPARDLPGVAR